jgi:hypothetical protein
VVLGGAQHVTSSVAMLLLLQLLFMMFALAQLLLLLLKEWLLYPLFAVINFKATEI